MRGRKRGAAGPRSGHHDDAAERDAGIEVATEREAGIEVATERAAGIEVTAERAARIDVTAERAAGIEVATGRAAGIDVANVSRDVLLPDGGTARILHDVSLRIRPGEFVGLVGRNGSGKTTLARLMNGLMQPTAGTVRVDGFNTADGKDQIEVRRRTGMVFQNPDHQIVSSVVEEDVAFGPENLGLSPAKVRERTEWALEELGLSHLKRHAPNLLSGGQKQRVAIASILAMKPSHLILDEPTSMLDPWGRLDLLATLRMLNRDLGLTLVLISHQMEDLLLADRLVVLERGRIVRDGTPGEIFACESNLADWGIHVPDVPFLINALNRQSGISAGMLATVEELVGWLWQWWNSKT